MKHLAVLFLLTCLVGCKPNMDTEVHYSNLDWKEDRFYLRGELFTGIAWSYHEPIAEVRADLTPKCRREIIYGLRDGVTKEWYPDGTPQTEIHFSKGMRHGPNTYWKEDGSLLKKQIYEHNTVVSEEKY